MKANQQTSFVAMSVAVSFLLTAGGCKTHQAQARQPSGNAQPTAALCSDSSDTVPRQVVVLMLDRSLSLRRGGHDQWDSIREDASRLARQLAPATRVFVRFISEESYPDEARSLNGVIPEESSPLQCQPFDPRCRLAEQQRQARLHCVDDARVHVAAALQDLNPERAKKTDVWGTIAAASDVLSAYPQSQRMIVIYSDLIDTVGTKLPSQLPGLAHTRVLVRLVKNGNPREIAQRLVAFSQRLAQWGATVQSMTPEQPLDDGIFVQPPVTGALLTASK